MGTFIYKHKEHGRNILLTFYDVHIELAGVAVLGLDSAVAQEVGMRRAHPGSIGGQTHRVVEIPP
jgi:hypothetical protein